MAGSAITVAWQLYDGPMLGARPMAAVPGQPYPPRVALTHACSMAGISAVLCQPSRKRQRCLSWVRPMGSKGIAQQDAGYVFEMRIQQQW